MPLSMLWPLPLWNLCQMHLDSKYSAPQLCLAPQTGKVQASSQGSLRQEPALCPALSRQVCAECAHRICCPLDSGKGRTCFCWWVHGLTCANPEALVKHGHHCGSVPWGKEGSAEISAFSAAVSPNMSSKSKSPVNFRVWSSWEILASLPRGIKPNTLFEN